MLLQRMENRSESNTFFSRDKLIETLHKFAAFVEYKNGRTYSSDSVISFGDVGGFLSSEESYKSRAYENARNKLAVHTWAEDDIGTGKISKCVIEAVMEHDNLINHNQIISFKNTLNNNKQLIESETILYAIYKGADDGISFDNATKHFGASYDLISYLFFVKNRDSYIPVRSKRMDKSMEILEIDLKVSYHCTWDNYCKLIAIAKEILKIMNKVLRLKEPATLLDVQSFLWIIQEEESPQNPRVVFRNWMPDSNVIKSIQTAVEIGKLQTDKIDEITNTETEILVKARIGQGIYRDKLIKKHNCKCMLCGMKNRELLIASHIKEWSFANSEERLDENNGLLLCTLHDSLFDKHLISFTDIGEIIISDELDEQDRMLLNVNEDMKIKIEPEMKKYLSFHRESLLNRMDLNGSVII